MRNQPALPPGQTPPAPLLPHEALDLRLRQAAKRLHLGAFDLLELIREAIDTKVHEHYGFLDAVPYLEDRTGLKARTIYRQLAVLDGLRALPPADHEEARFVLAELGVHRAAILAPALEQEPHDWREWAALAREGTEEALQEAVSSACGLKARGPASHPGEKFLAFILERIPPERRSQTKWVFQEMGKLGDPQNAMNPVGVFLALVDLGEQDLAAAGICREAK